MDTTERFMDDIQEALAREYSARQTDIVKQAMSNRCAEGYSVTRPPLGYGRTLVKGLYKPTRFGSALSTILQGLADGSVSLTDTIWILQLSSKARTSRKTTRGRVLELISDPYYAGFVSLNGKHYPGKHKPLITVEQYGAILKALRSSPYPLPKNLYCPVCSEL